MKSYPAIGGRLAPGERDLSLETASNNENNSRIKSIQSVILQSMINGQPKGFASALAQKLFSDDVRVYLFDSQNLYESIIVGILQSIKMAIYRMKNPNTRKLCELRFISFLDVFITTLEKEGFEYPEIFKNCYPSPNMSDASDNDATFNGVLPIDENNCSDCIYFFDVQTKDIIFQQSNGTMSFGSSYKPTFQISFPGFKSCPDSPH